MQILLITQFIFLLNLLIGINSNETYLVKIPSVSIQDSTEILNLLPDSRYY